MPAPAVPDKRSDLIWFDGDFIPWNEAQVHVLTHALHYGSSVFEGIRCYATPDGPRVFRLGEHMERLLFSARVAKMKIPYTAAELTDTALELIARNGFEGCYVRPLVFRGAGGMGLMPRDCPVHVILATWEWGTYLGADALTEGIDVMVSNWRKMAPGTIPSLVKLGGAYCLATLAKMEALAAGYAEAILLDVEGRVAEGTGENLFAVYEGRLWTPPLCSSVLGGITRKSIMQIARDTGIEVVEQPMNREFMHLAEEVFLTGTAAEVTAVRSVDRIPVGSGKPGPVTQRLQGEFFDIVHGKKPDRYNWLTPVTVSRAPQA